MTTQPLSWRSGLTTTQRHEFLKFPDVDGFVLGRDDQLSGSDLRFLDNIGDMTQKFGLAVWNTVYLQRAVEHLKSEGTVIPDEILQQISPLGYEHINLTGDDVCCQEELPLEGEFLPLRLKKK